MAIGPHKFEFEVIRGWGQLPEGWSYFEVAGVGVDSQDRVYVFTRGKHPIIVFDKEGKFLNAWGEGIFTSPHGVFVDRDDNIYLADDGDHTVRVFDTDGNLKMTLGEPGVAAETGYIHDHRPVLFGGKPFNRVTNVAKGRNGDLYVSDGYGNARVHRFSADGKHITSWGQPGSRPGEFNLPHAIGVDSGGRVYVADRENSRVQIFTADGAFIREWTWMNRPLDIFIDDQDNIHISESGWVKPTGTPLHYNNKHAPVCGHDPISQVTVCDPDGKVVAQVGGHNPVLPGNFVAPHGIYCDSEGSLYVGQVIQRSGSAKYFAPLPLEAFQKFKRAG